MRLRAPHFVSPHRLLCLLLGISASFPALAEEQKLYEVEIILFSTPAVDSYDSEVWQKKTGSPNLKNNIELYSPGRLLLEENLDNLPKYFIEAEFDAPSKKSLARYARRITNSPDYELVFHKAWRQPLDKKAVFLIDEPDTNPILFEESGQLPDMFIGLKNETIEKTAEELLLEALLEEEKDFSRPLSQLPFFISELDEIEPFEDTRNLPVSQPTPLSYEGPPQHLAYGNVVLSKGRYLHMSLDFLYRGKPYTPEAEIQKETLDSFMKSLREPETEKTDEPPITGFRLKSSKRVRLNKIYYIDHPLFGVIIRIIRYSPPL